MNYKYYCKARLNHFPVKGNIVIDVRSDAEFYCKTCGKEFPTYNDTIHMPHNEGCDVAWISETNVERAKK